LLVDAAGRDVKEASVGIVVHFEFSVPDPEKTAAFYRAAFGWVATKLADPLKYWQLKTPQTDRLTGLPGGIVESKTGEARISLTIQVDSMDEACARVVGLGGQLVTDRRVVPGYGVHVLCKDPQGCFFALIEPPGKD
jgi:predicted enzyme related to lactoylglutathione lyase